MNFGAKKETVCRFDLSEIFAELWGGLTHERLRLV